MRLGLALHKTRQEIRDLPSTEYHEWELMYMLEPWGWEEQEYKFGKLLAEIFYIANKGKKQFKAIDFMRDMKKNYKIDEDDISDWTQEELKKYRQEHREEIRAAAKMAMGVK
jgi:hypothetical protein